MKIIGDPATIIVTAKDGTQQVLFNVVTVDYDAPTEVYHDCSKTSAPLDVIKKLIAVQGYVKVKLWNHKTYIATEYIASCVYDDLIFNDNTTLSNLNVPRFNPSRVGYAVFGYWENL